MNRGQESERFEEFVARCRADDRVSLVADTLTRGATFDLIACCDAFVSLHRSEGFGRCIAEAMALGKPVIATGYSGNLDFCSPETSCLVRFKKVPVKEEQYWHSAGQVWAEPDVDHAAEWMTRLLEDPDLRNVIGSAGQRFVRERHSLRAAGARYMARLRPK
jgi:glycosyltransferase involved in cell wall biosynthesis